jgi:hypothetical protein
MMDAESLFRNARLFMLFPLLILLLLASEVHAIGDTGYLSVTSEPELALVYLNARYIGTTPVLREPEEQGQYRIDVSKRGCKLHQERIVIKRGQILEIRFLLAKEDSETSAESTKRYVEAYIEVGSEPSGADVYLDDKLIGKTPVKNYPIIAQAGEAKDRKLKLTKSGYKTYEGPIKSEDIKDVIRLRVPVKLTPLVSAIPPVSPQRDRRLIVDTRVIIIFTALLVVIAILITRIVIKLRHLPRGKSSED